MSTIEMLKQSESHTEFPPASGDHVTIASRATMEARRLERKARRERIDMEVQSYLSLDGQSTRQDAHKHYAALAGLEEVTSLDWSNGYTTGAKLAFALNKVVNEVEGETETDFRTVVITSEPEVHTMGVLAPVDRVRACLATLNVAFNGWGLRFAQLKPTSPRIIDGKVFLLKQVVRQRPVDVKQVPYTHPKAPVWRNPYQIEEGFMVLPTSKQGSPTKAECEGLSLLQDSSGRLHLVYWVTKPNGKRVRKSPIAVRSFPIPTDVEDAIHEMRAIGQAMASTAREMEDSHLLPFMAAEVTATSASVSAPEVLGTHEWLTLVSDQRQTNEVYRNRGASPE